ncbi:hypothetical protein KA005_78905 [bacterium]|nr:hypothetical protein [bacterium]
MSEGYISQWFLKELLVIDPTYFVKWDKHFNSYYSVHKRMNINRIDKDTGICINIKNPVVATFKHLNHSALDNLRKRKQMGAKFCKPHDPLAYLKFIVKQNQEGKRKAKQLAREMVTEGFMKIHKLQTSKQFDMGER